MLSSGPVKSIDKWVAKNPGKTIAATSLFSELVAWVINSIHRAPDDGISALLAVLRKNIPSISWSEKKMELTQQLTDYAGQSPSHRAAIVKCITEAGFEIELPPAALNELTSLANSDQDVALLAEFSSAAESRLQKRMPDNTYMAATERIRLLKRVARSLGGYDTFLAIRTAILVLDESDVERARILDDVGNS